MEIFDTAGFYSVAAYRDSLYKCSDGFVLTFSISDEESFNNLDFLQNRIRINRPDASLILVGEGFITCLWVYEIKYFGHQH